MKAAALLYGPAAVWPTASSARQPGFIHRTQALREEQARALAEALRAGDHGPAFEGARLAIWLIQRGIFNHDRVLEND